MTSFEEHLRAELRAVAEGRPRAVGLASLVSDRLDGRARRARVQRTTFVVASVAFAVIAGAVALLAPARSHGTTPLAMSTPRDGRPGWMLIPDAPISERFQHTAVDVDGEVLVFGGYRDDSGAAGAALYDPSSGRWREAADPPGDMRSAVAAWTGSVVLVLDVDGRLHSYDPRHDRWAALARSPLARSGNAVTEVVWTGEVLLGVQNLGDQGSAIRVVSYDPGEDEWTVYEEGPIVSLAFGAAAWTGEELLIVGSHVGTTSTHPGLDLMAFSPDDGWSAVPAPPLARLDARTLGYSVWTGDELVVGGGMAWSEEAVALAAALVEEDRSPTAGELQVMAPTAALDAAAWNPTTHAWRSLPDAPVPSTGLSRYADLWTGREVVSWEVDSADPYALTGRVVLMDPLAGTWRTSDVSPLGYQQDAPATWTGHEIVIFSGEPTVSDPDPRGCCDPLPVGVSFVP